MPYDKEKKSKKEQPKEAVQAKSVNDLSFKPTAAWLKKIKAVLSQHKYVKVIYINDSGDYHFNGVEGFVPVNASDIMNAEIPEEKKPEGGDGAASSIPQF